MLLKDVIREADWCVCIRTSYAKKKKKKNWHSFPYDRQSVKAEERRPFIALTLSFFFPKNVFLHDGDDKNRCRDAAFETNYAKYVTKMIHAMRTRQQPWPA